MSGANEILVPPQVETKQTSLSLDTILPQKYSKLVWIIFSVLTFIVAGVESTMILAFGHDSKYAAIAAIWVGVVAAILRFITTNSMNASAKVLFLVLGGAISLQLTSCSSIPVRREICVDYVRCAARVDAVTAGGINATFGDTSACWASDKDARACVEGCIAGLESLEKNGVSCEITKEIK